MSEANKVVDHVEAILTWRLRDKGHLATDWLAQQGFQIIPMRAGLLVSGDRSDFERVFGVLISREGGATSLPIPQPLEDIVRSIVVPGEPQFGHDSEGKQT